MSPKTPFHNPYHTSFPLMEKLISTQYPQVFTHYYPRIYESVGQYNSPKYLAYGLAHAHITLVQDIQRFKTLERTPIAFRLLAPALLPFSRHNCPLMFIAPDLLAAIKQTGWQDELSWADMNLPYEEGCFILPKGGLKHPTDGEVPFIFWSRKRGGFYHLPRIDGLPNFEVSLEYQCFSIMAFCPYSSHLVWYDVNLTMDKRPTVKFGHLFDNVPPSNQPEDPRTGLDITPEDMPFVEQMASIVFGTFLAMAARPTLQGYEEKLRALKPKHLGDKPKQIWSPNIIGKHYRIQHQQLGGTHASPRMHWRRGHFRNQPYGPALQLVKRIWLEPSLIACKEESA